MAPGSLVSPEGLRSSSNSDPLNCIRSILVETLSSENVARSDMLKVRQFTKKSYIDTRSKQVVDKEVRLKHLKDRQNEERHKKLEEMKAQALAAQRFKDQKEHERRRRLEDLRVKEDVRRQQVEERKRAINEAERDRLESILRRNHEREARIEAKKRNERSNIVFAFGSSTPRMLDPTDMTASFWGRRATSTQNITISSSSLTRRQSERDLDIGSKKRATSASGLERSGESSAPTTPAGCVSGYVGRRRTDLMPTVPTKESSSFTSSRKSLSQSPGRAYSMSRLDQLAKPRKRPDLPALVESSAYPSRPLSSPRMSSVTRSMIHLAVSKTGPSPTRRTTLSKADSRSMHQLSVDGPLLAPRTTRATQLRQQKLNASSNCSEASSRPSSSLSQQSTNSVASSVSVRHRPTTTPRRPRPASIAITGVTHDLKNHHHHSDKSGENKPPLPRRRKSISKTQEKPPVKNPVKSPIDSTPKIINNNSNNSASIVDNKANKDPGEAQQKPPDTNNVNVKETVEVEKHLSEVKEVPDLIEELTKVSISEIVPVAEKTDVIPEEKILEEPEPIVENQAPVIVDVTVEPTTTPPAVVPTPQLPETIVSSSSSIIETITETNTSNSNIAVENNSTNEMTTSMSKPRITTEEEAKAALAERRRLAREEAERLAEQKRLQIEAEAIAERERQQKEEEQLRLIIEQQRAAEQERLEEAIRETQKRDEEEKLRREEEQRLKIQKEEQAKEEAEKAEKQKAELQEKLKNEEKEREARRKRVEAIMSRTRGKTNANSSSQQNSEDKNEDKLEDKNENKSENKMNGTKTGEQENGTTKNGDEIEIVDNIIPDDTLKNANNVTINTINSTDSINSNNSWQTTQQFDSLM